MTKQYTVIGYYADNAQPYMGWVTAASPAAAARKAIASSDAGEELMVVEVVTGKIKGVLGNDKVMPAESLVGYTG